MRELTATHAALIPIVTAALDWLEGQAEPRSALSMLAIDDRLGVEESTQVAVAIRTLIGRLLAAYRDTQ